jgi:hypothetical protein
MLHKLAHQFPRIELIRGEVLGVALGDVLGGKDGLIVGNGAPALNENTRSSSSTHTTFEQ